MRPTRRQTLQVGYSGFLGLALGGRAAGRPSAVAHQPTGKAKSVILVFCTGGPSHIDTFDPKPDAPSEIRGEFATIDTKVPGLRFTDILPKLAARADRFATVRSFAHRENNHLVATHHLLTGHPQPGAFFDKVASRDDWPSYAAAVNAIRPRADGIPTGVNLPTFLVEGALTWPGQHAGFLGPKHDPWQVTRDPNAADFQVADLIPAGFDVTELENRTKLLAEVNAGRKWLGDTADGKRLSDQQQQALTVLTSGKVATAFDIGKEPEKVRDAYGRHPFGQSILLARRLVEAGVPVVQANMGKVQNWDSHGDNFGRLKDKLVPPLDAGVSALLDDLADRGLLDTTLVVVLGEFGRTPKISVQREGQKAGRDHWAACFSGLFAGAGVRGGQIIGKSDKVGAYPVTPPVTPDDVGATVYTALGVDPGCEVRDRFDRPVTLNRGQPLDALYTG